MARSSCSLLPQVLSTSPPRNYSKIWKYLKTLEIFILGYGAPGAEAGSGEEVGSGDAAARAEEDYAGI